MLSDFNLLLSAPRDRENQACSEAWHFLKQVGDEKAEVDFTGLTGLIVAKTALDPFHVVEKWRILAEEQPWDFRVLLKATPIELVVSSDLEAIAGAVEKLAGKVGEDESFRITVNKRGSRLHTEEIIKAAGSKVPRKVDLEGFQKNVNIEVIRSLTGVSILTPNEILSISKIRSKWLAGRYEATS